MNQITWCKNLLSKFPKYNSIIFICKKYIHEMNDIKENEDGPLIYECDIIHLCTDHADRDKGKSTGWCDKECIHDYKNINQPERLSEKTSKDDAIV